ncbi:MAG: DUF1294 domain-containing protein [Clostridia bacterium]|nr:DUF1294 domain-containing protein [Clostridia bacterium]
MIWTKIFTVYICVCSLVAFVLYGVDKRKAQKEKWRISEKCLLGISFLGGGIGGYLAMHIFRHKTKHWYFHALHILGIAWQVALWVFLLLRFGF